jgi:hypothetical protein
VLECASASRIFCDATSRRCYLGDWIGHACSYELPLTCERLIVLKRIRFLVSVSGPHESKSHVDSPCHSDVRLHAWVTGLSGAGQGNGDINPSAAYVAGDNAGKMAVPAPRLRFKAKEN